MKDKKMKKPSPFLYYPLGALAKLIAKPLMRLEVDKTEFQKLKKPYVLMSNHASKLDVLYAVCSVFPTRLSIVAGRDAFTWKILKPFLPFLHVIPKSQFGMDLASIRNMQNALESGCNLYICPEGKSSLDGKPIHYLPPAIGKFVKFTGAPVVTAKIEGAYLTLPRYSGNLRRGKVKVTLKTIVSEEEVGTLTAKEIYARIVENIDYNDHIYQHENGLKFRTKAPAKKLNYILYQCPKCGAEYYNIVEDDLRHIRCTACGNRVEYTEYGNLVPDEGSIAPERVDLWYQMERDTVLAQLEAGDFAESHPVQLLTVNEVNDFVPSGKGTLSIDKKKITYEGSVDGETKTVEFPIAALHSITTKNKEGIDLMDGDKMFRFMFEDKKHSTKWGLVVEENYRINNKL